PPGGLLDGVHGVPTVKQGKWLRYVIEHIQDWPTNRVRDLLPWKV
ncbi:transposase domain-containing protein, partial [Escherichia coli]|nr:transposase domain-containing protein [Escherichia coli]EIK8708563.1 transposase domain-containing protein [Escherichia coli]EKC5287524.1 transposase domain-containing protein [Escherichia coli]EKP9884032.1 transposase domain-containing protein [Escherichia coli]EKY5391757.1 transposase domain-containing protein [Escherichia coli]